MADKRVAEASDESDSLPQRKRPRSPTISSTIRKMFRSLEPFFCRIVREEVEGTIARAIGGRYTPKQIERPDGRNLELHFRTKLPKTFFTGEEIEGEEGAVIHVVLLDAKTGSPVTSGPEAFAKLDVFVLDGDFNKEDNDNWIEDEFEKHIVREREGKRPLLTGDLQVYLKEGVGTLGKLCFTDNSSWIRSGKFILALKVATGYCTASRIREAMTGRFVVKARRGQLHKKHHPPALDDDLWRLEGIAKDGAFQKKLNEEEIQTVEDFLTRLFSDPQGLRKIIGRGMPDKNWKKLVGHAKAAVLSSKPYVYYLDETKHVGAIFNKKQDFWGLVEGDQFTSVECLSHRQKDLEDTLVKMAHANWSATVLYHCKEMKFTKSDATATPQKDPMLDSADCSSSRGVQDPQLLSQSLVPISVQRSDSREGGGFIPIEYDENPAAALPDQPHNAESNTYLQIASTCSSGRQVAGDADNIMTELQAVSDTSEAHQGQSNDGFDDLEAWIRSLTWDALMDSCLTGNTIRGACLMGNAVIFSKPALTDPDPAQDYSWTPYSGLNVMQNSAQSSTSAAAAGWAKVVAALRWAFCIRKKATDRR